MPLNEEDMRRLDDRYVSRQECETKTDKTQAAIAQMQTDMAVMCTTQKATNKWLAVIATAIITGLVAFATVKIFGG